jgi:hypothetical protein
MPESQDDRHSNLGKLARFRMPVFSGILDTILVLHFLPTEERVICLGRSLQGVKG